MRKKSRETTLGNSTSHITSVGGAGGAADARRHLPVLRLELDLTILCELDVDGRSG